MRIPRRLIAVAMLLHLATVPALAQAAEAERLPDEGQASSLGDGAQLAICFPDVCFLPDVGLDSTPDITVPDPLLEGYPDRPILEEVPEEAAADMHDGVAGDANRDITLDIEGLDSHLLRGAAPEFIEAGTKLDRPVVRSISDADLSGKWKVTSRGAQLECSVPAVGRTIRQPIKKSVSTLKIARGDDGALIGSGLGTKAIDMAMLAPGIYGTEYRLKRKGLTFETRSFLGMQAEGSFKGMSIVRASGKQGDCTMSQRFVGVRISGADSGAPSK